MILRTFMILGLLLAGLTGCRRESAPLSPDLPATPILTAESQWGVVNRSYVKVLKTTDITSPVNGLLRQGDVVEILSKTGTGDGLSYWLELSVPETTVTGWVPDSSLDVYDSHAQARTARSVMLTEN
jgi:hypothetical protein